MLTRNQSIASSSGSIPSSKHRINHPATTLSPGRSGDIVVSDLNTVSPPLPVSDVASWCDPYPLSLSGSTVSDGAAVDGVTSSDSHCSIDEDDIVIAVMGPTGAGKSSFVNTAAGREEAMRGDDLRSKTRALQSVRCPHPDGRRNIVLVDTPGFDDTELSDAQILREIADWLKNTYQNNIKLTGLLYLHRISDVRLAGTPLRNLAVFRDLCGKDNLKNVVLITTMWDDLEDLSVGFKREGELLSSFWKGMTNLGSRACRYQGTHESAWEVIKLLDLEGSRQRRTPLQIQWEMVDRKMSFHETAAAKTLFRFLAKVADNLKRVWENIRNKARRGKRPRNPPGGPGRNAIATRDSTYLPSPTGTTSSGCSATGRQDALSAMITSLKFAHQLADISPVPMLRGTIGTVLYIAQLIQGMGGLHHAIIQVVENSGWLLEEITTHAAGSPLSRDMNRTLDSFQSELTNLQRVVMKIKERGPIPRFFLYDADISAITACTTSIKGIYDKLEVKLAMDNRLAIARLEDQLAGLFHCKALRQCECHEISVVHEESQENVQRSATMGQSA